MARAIAPSKIKAAREHDAASKVVMTFRWTDETGDHLVDLAFSNLGARETLMVRKATGVHLEVFTTPVVAGNSGIGLDTLATLWWLARRLAGEEVDFEELLGKVTYRWQPDVTVENGEEEGGTDPTGRPSGSVLDLPA
jgi:hypothetical protein